MRFINTTTLTFQDVFDEELSSLDNGYCVLSHRWIATTEEVDHTDILSRSPAISSKEGYAKFRGACDLASKLGYDLIWIDTCCINKTDSVELGEAINSMFRWYSLAKLCIVYLQDAPTAMEFASSDWFNRGWTLQELIAPRTVQFYSSSWNYLGNKTSLTDILSEKTGIPADVLQNQRPAQACSIAQRMSWAAKRRTRRVEDRAYSLMGLFDVNMPMIYGEREQAFIRLQERIIRKSADESIFAWDMNLAEANDDGRMNNFQCGLLATSPASFAKCGHIITTGRSKGFRMNQFGLAVTLPATVNTLERFQVSLSAKQEDRSEHCSIILARVPGEDAYVRIRDDAGRSVVPIENRSESLMRFNVSDQAKKVVNPLYHGFWLRELSFDTPHVSAFDRLERQYTAEVDRLPLPLGEIGTAGILRLHLQRYNRPDGFGLIKLGFDPWCRPVCLMAFPYPKSIGWIKRCQPACFTDEPSREEQDYYSKFTSVDIENALSCERGSQTWLNHSIFDDSWTLSTDPTVPFQGGIPPPSNLFGVEMRVGNANYRSAFNYFGPLFSLSIIFDKVPDIHPLDTRHTDREVWAVSIRAFEATMNACRCC